MKRLAAVLAAACLFLVPVHAGQASTFDYVKGMTGENTTYMFNDLMLILPADWDGKITVETKEQGVYFYQSESYERYMEDGMPGGGFLCSLSASKDDSYTSLPSYRFLGISDISGLHYYLSLPSDYPAYMEGDIPAEYDRMLEQVDYIVENVKFFSEGPGLSGHESGSTFPDAAEAGPSGGEEGAADDPQISSDPVTAAWTPQEVRNEFEHSMIPRYFFESPDSMLDGIDEVGIYWLWESVCGENGVDPYYPKENYIEHWYPANENGTFVQIELPDPEANLLCYRIYLIYDPSTGQTAYYTAEYDNLLGDACFLCSWDEDRTHSLLDELEILDRTADDYNEKLRAEAEKVAQAAGVALGWPVEDGSIHAEGDEGTEAGSDTIVTVDGDDIDEDLEVISCPEQEFSFKADPSYIWDYNDGTGITVYTEGEKRIPYIIVYRAEDLIVEAYEYITEQFTPHMQQQYGDNLVEYTEYEAYEIGGKQLPAGLYKYNVEGTLVDLLRIYDSTGSQTVAYTAKYIDGQGEAELKALDTAVRTFTEE